MKKYLLVLSTFTVIAFTATAQVTSDSTNNASTKAKKYTNHFDRMHQHRHGNYMAMKNLNLTDAQKQQAKDLNDNYRNQLKQLEKNGDISLNDYRAKKASLAKERKLKFESILTQEQKDKIAQAKKERSEKMKMMSQKRMEKMKSELDLTDEQVTKIKEQRENSMSQAKAIKENSSLTEEQKKEQLMNLRKSSKESINSILTADQLKKREEIRDSRMNDWKNKKADKNS